MDVAVSTRSLTKRFGSTVALDGLDLTVPTGVVFGYLGPNGAGKTTTLRLLVGLLRPTRGTATVLGLDVARDRRRVHAAVGYLPGNFVAPAHLDAREYLAFIGDLRGGVDPRRVDELCDRFDLDRSRRIGSMSRGNRQKVGIVQAFMHDPAVLILDEPTSGLDPLMQREFLGLVGECRDAGATVVLSSHILSEVGEIAETVAIVRAGRLVVVDSVEALQRRASRRIDLDLVTPPPAEVLERVPGVSDVRIIGTVAHVIVNGSTEALMAAAVPFGIENVVTYEADLEQAFLGYYEKELVS